MPVWSKHKTQRRASGFVIVRFDNARKMRGLSVDSTHLANFTHSTHLPKRIRTNNLFFFSMVWLMEFITLHCAGWVPSGTAIEVMHRETAFVEFRAYTGASKGMHGFALNGDVRW
jgi:hypothetical protein